MQFFTRRFYLDSPANRSKNRGGEFFVGPFKSFWVSATNNSSFQCDLVINPTGSSDDRGIPLRLNQCQAFGDKPDSACVEFTVAQPGVWIDITFAQDDSISVGSVVVESSGSSVISEGSSHSSVKVDLPVNVVTQIIPNNDKRAVTVLQLKTGGAFWIGNPDELNDANWKDRCECVELAIGQRFIWKNTAALNARVDVGGDACVFSSKTEEA